LAALLHGTLVVGVSQTAAFNRGRHLYSAGRPSGWALAHILVYHVFVSIKCLSTVWRQIPKIPNRLPLFYRSYSVL